MLTIYSIKSLRGLTTNKTCYEFLQSQLGLFQLGELSFKLERNLNSTTFPSIRTFTANAYSNSNIYFNGNNNSTQSTTHLHPSIQRTSKCLYSTKKSKAPPLPVGIISEIRRLKVAREAKRPLKQKNHNSGEINYRLWSMGSDGLPLAPLKWVTGISNKSSFPDQLIPEVLFVGRSNAGKSMLINAVAQADLVRVKNHPGVTRTLTYFRLGNICHFVDSPGYGFAFAKQNERDKWMDMIYKYLSMGRSSLKQVFLIIDSSKSMEIEDKRFLELLDGMNIPVSVILTKCDLVPEILLGNRNFYIRRFLEPFRYANPNPIMVSSVTESGISQLRQFIFKLVKYQPQPVRTQIAQDLLRMDHERVQAEYNLMNDKSKSIQKSFEEKPDSDLYGSHTEDISDPGDKNWKWL